MIRLIALLVLLAAPVRAEQVVVFAAASLAGALDEIAAAWEAETGYGVVLSYGGSAAMAQQIRQGAPADVFVSASPDWMDVLEQDGLIVPGSRVDLLTNRLVLIGHGAGLEPWTEVQVSGIADTLLSVDRLAVALTEAVPAGIYARAALGHLGLWDGLRDRLAETDNVRAALQLVALGEAPLGIVYATDAAASDAVSVLWTFARDSHPPIVYPLAEVKNAVANASLLRRYLNGPVAREIFVAHGFGVLPQ